MELPEMGTWKGGSENGRSRFRFVLNGLRGGCKIRETAFNLNIEKEI